MFPLSSQYDTILRENAWTASCEIVGHSLQPNRDAQRRNLRESLDLETSPLPTAAAWLKEPPKKGRDDVVTKSRDATTRSNTALQSLWEQLGIPSHVDADNRNQQTSRLKRSTPSDAPATKPASTLTYESALLERLFTQREE